MQAVIVMLGLSATTVMAEIPCGAEVDCAFAELDADVRALTERYLRTDCGFGVQSLALTQELVEVGTQARRYLEAVRAQGPPRQVLRELEQTLDRAWASMQAYLATDYAHRAGADWFEQMTEITEEEYFENQRESLDAGYRERASLALRAISNGTCFGKIPTIVGTSGDDHISGTLGDDVIAGLGGNDVIFGRGGHDIVCAGTGDDQITTREGSDLISGGDGRDTVASGAGDDLVLGGDKDDDIDGGDGKDRLKGSAGADVIAGGAGDDTLIGGTGLDTLDGGAGSDICIGGEKTTSCP
jgi:Ca2+-binding RTX toxin-like protein